MSNLIKLVGGGYEAVVDVSRGATCIGLRNAEYNASILREPDTESIDSYSFLYGMPILFPANRISDGCFRFEGRRYVFPINEPNTNCHVHGTLSKQPFEVVSVSADTVKCGFCEDYLGFPHKFRVEITYNLSENGLTQTVEIFNLSDTNMPVMLGFHTTFNVPFLSHSKKENVRLLCDVSDEIERDTLNYLPTGRILLPDTVTDAIKNGEKLPLDGALSRHYKTGDGGRIELVDIAENIKTVYETDQKFGFRLLFNGNASEYICLEPMTNMANCANSPFDREYAGFDHINPNSSKTYITKIYLQKI